MKPITVTFLGIGVVVLVLMLIVNNKERIRFLRKDTVEPEISGTRMPYYDKYAMTPVQRLMYTLLAAAVMFALGYLFYRHFVPSLLLACLSIRYPGIKEKQIIKKRQSRLQQEFQDALYAIYTSMSAGSSPTNAIISASDDLKRLYIGSGSLMVPELEVMKSRLKMNQPVEDVLSDFADRSGLDDVANFTEVFITSMDTGGRQAAIIKSTINTIIEKIEIKREIDVMIAEKRFESSVMNVMPIGIILFLSVAAGDYLTPLYDGIGGRIVTTFVILILIVGSFMSSKIMDIEV